MQQHWLGNGKDNGTHMPAHPTQANRQFVLRRSGIGLRRKWLLKEITWLWKSVPWKSMRLRMNWLTAHVCKVGLLAQDRLVPGLVARQRSVYQQCRHLLHMPTRPKPCRLSQIVPEQIQRTSVSILTSDAMDKALHRRPQQS